MTGRVTHVLILPLPNDRLHTWCGLGGGELTNTYVTTSPEAVTCTACVAAMRVAKRQLDAWTWAREDVGAFRPDMRPDEVCDVVRIGMCHSPEKLGDCRVCQRKLRAIKTVRALARDAEALSCAGPDMMPFEEPR